MIAPYMSTAKTPMLDKNECMLFSWAVASAGI
jgi:hypothetical protein